MRVSFATVYTLLFAAFFLLASTNASGLRSSATPEEHPERRLGLPSECPADAIPGNCKQCNHGGCGILTCSAFTTWTCPDGYEVCGYETCLGGACPVKKWCVKSS